MRSTLSDIQVIFVHQTDKAVCVKRDESAEPVWIPEARCQIEPDDPERGQVVTLTAPERVIIERGLA